MQLIRLVILLSLSMRAIAQSEDSELKPCGTVVKSIRLKRDCSAPMVIAANNVRVNLNGHTIHNVPPGFDGYRRAGVEVLNRRGVTVENGTIIGPRIGLFVQGGDRHTFRNLHVQAEGVWVTPQYKVATAVAVEDVDRAVLKRITTTPGLTSPVFIFIGKRSKISQVDSLDVAIFGDDLLISDNKFSGDYVGGQATCGLTYSGQRSVIRRNTLTTPGTKQFTAGLCIEGSDNVFRHNLIAGVSAGLRIGGASVRNVISHNDITSDPTVVPDAVDIKGGDDPCANIWKHNNFKTDSEGDGPDAGCIR